MPNHILMRSASLILPLVWAVTILWSASIFWSTGVVFAAGETANVRNVLIEVYVAKETQTGATVVETVQKIAWSEAGFKSLYEMLPRRQTIGIA